MTSDIDQLDINEIFGENIKNCLINVIKKRLKSDDVEFHVEHGSKKGDNFQGEIFRILYKESNNNADENESSLILKIAPKIRQNYSSNIFVREINIYDQVLSYFNEFQLSKGIDPEVDGFNECPTCYFSIKENMSEALFLEDLKRRQFEMFNHREEAITFDHIALFMKAIGKFHAISFAVKDQQPEKFKEFTKFVPEHFWVLAITEYKELFLVFLNRFKSVLEEKSRPDLWEKFEKAAGGDFIEFLSDLMPRAANDSCAVISHGDATINNTMFSKDENGKPTAIQIFDWQFSRCSTPIFDLVIYLFLTATKELRDQHYDEFLKIYHNSFSDLLKKLGSDPEKLFSYETLLSQLKQYGIYVAFVAGFFIPILYADKYTISYGEEMVAEEVFIPSAESKPKYEKHVLELFGDLDRLGYF